MDNKLKVLCLHGYRQDGATFRSKIGSFRKNLKSNTIFETIDAPHISNCNIKEGENEEDLSNVCQRSWWFTTGDKTYTSRIESDIDEGFQESLAVVEDHIEKNGPFDGLLGFSQGATFAALICSLIQRGGSPSSVKYSITEFKANFKFVLLFAGFKSLCSPHLKYYDVKLSIPSLHIIGDTDQIISKERSEALLEIFENPEVLRHPGGHYIPTSKDIRSSYKEFFQKFR